MTKLERWSLILGVGLAGLLIQAAAWAWLLGR